MKRRNVAAPGDAARRGVQDLVTDPGRPLLFCVMGNTGLKVAPADRRSSISRRITRGCQPGGVRRESRRPARATATQLISAGSAMTAMEFAVHGDQPPQDAASADGYHILRRRVFQGNPPRVLSFAIRPPPTPARTGLYVVNCVFRHSPPRTVL